MFTSHRYSLPRFFLFLVLCLSALLLPSLVYAQTSSGATFYLRSGDPDAIKIQSIQVISPPAAPQNLHLINTAPTTSNSSSVKNAPQGYSIVTLPSTNPTQTFTITPSSSALSPTNSPSTSQFIQIIPLQTTYPPSQNSQAPPPPSQPPQNILPSSAIPVKTPSYSYQAPLQKAPPEISKLIPYPESYSTPTPFPVFNEPIQLPSFVVPATDGFEEPPPEALPPLFSLSTKQLKKLKKTKKVKREKYHISRVPEGYPTP